MEGNIVSYIEHYPTIWLENIQQTVKYKKGELSLTHPHSFSRRSPRENLILKKRAVKKSALSGD